MPKEKKPMSKQAIYSMISSSAKELISELLTLSKDKNPYIKIQAIKILLNKIIPDLKEKDISLTEVKNEIDEHNPKILKSLIKLAQAVDENLENEKENTENSPGGKTATNLVKN